MKLIRVIKKDPRGDKVKYTVEGVDTVQKMGGVAVRLSRFFDESEIETRYE